MADQNHKVVDNIAAQMKKQFPNRSHAQVRSDARKAVLRAERKGKK